MADSKTILQKYVSDMLALETHIHQAIDKQVKENQDDPEASSKFVTYAQTTASHTTALQARLDQLGGAANNPVKQGVAAVAGVAAGIIDKFRSEEVSKDFRDDFTAINLSLISYQMLHTTALALGDRQTADLAATGARDNANMVMELQRLIPRMVVRDLKKNHEEVKLSLDDTAADETHKLISEVWK